MTIINIDLPKCICGADWEYDSLYNDKYHKYCSKQCGFSSIYRNGYCLFLIKKLKDERELWLCYGSDSRCELLTFKKTYKTLNFIPPFNITIERLNLLLILS